MPKLVVPVKKNIKWTDLYCDLLPVNLAKASQGIKLVCFSSDQVYSGFDKEGPFKEDTVKPANIYAKHKLEMENRVLDIDPDAVMLRAEWMYDYYLKKSNYFMNIINAGESIAVSPTQYRGITYVKEVADNMEKVARMPGGIYNFGSETDMSMYEITRDFVSLLGKNTKVEKDESARPNLWMKCDKARLYGVNFSSVTDALKLCAKDYSYI
jgi:dTDP-4-dehydrorhamnose reductase